MRVLAVEGATEACSVALFDRGATILRCIEAGKSHAQKILAMVEEVLAEGQVRLSMLDGIAASVGPGAFTGVRISVAVAQGLAFGADLGVVAVGTLEALALAALSLEALALEPLDDSRSRAIACLDARMGEVYWGCFEAEPTAGVVATSAPRVGPPAQVTLAPGGRYIGIGRGFSAHPVLEALAGIEVGPKRRLALPCARETARLGALRLAHGGGIDPAHLTPLYLRDKVALTEAERAAR
ncbi:MAG TPA: tRNA (adenosine(37)-N6)-threonylcarbamoyltransferase complex dimerization subunit type 1 TsaB [Steroidobacteraceae bacterium]|jgi:tRNA threonylcarbamoyladenosine biosynthesis protein TsaB|nr:tRNA (adenosine(37)-N6)-threonylcarbamoyltransferase complex dimerization subunit type 1 TsaB [Steroidobacteraceae bacterium]